MKYKKTLAELEKVAIKWWPKDLEAEVASASVIPSLLKTQEQFLSVLKLSQDTPEQVFDVLAASSLSANLFLKHLMVLVDYGGELVRRLGVEFDNVFPIDKKTNQRIMQYSFRGKNHCYVFKSLPVKGLGNTKLSVDGVAIIAPRKLDGLTQDMCMILMHGATVSNNDKASLERCDIGGILGNAQVLDRYVREKYIHVSRITTGASANSLGQIAQTHVANFLRNSLDSDYLVTSNTKVYLRDYDNKDGMPFDVVISRKKKIVGVEVSFQVTSNSVIERKAAQAEYRRNLMRHEGHFIAYVLDGAGNFSRSAALNTLCQSSDCTVSFADEQLAVLSDFIKGKLSDSLR
jgi:hypothetical protein